MISSPWRDRIELVAGDFYQSDFPDGVDFVWISAIIHSESVEETRTLFRKSRLALLDGGMIAIRDFFPHVGRIPPLPASLFNVNMLMNSEKGKVYGREEVFDLLTETGFRNPRLAIPSEGMDAVIVAEK